MPEPAFDDGSTVEVECPTEDPPRSGQWVDAEPSAVPVTDEEGLLGEYLSQAIDVDDDEDNGAGALHLLAAAVERDRGR